MGPIAAVASIAAALLALLVGISMLASREKKTRDGGKELLSAVSSYWAPAIIFWVIMLYLIFD